MAMRRVLRITHSDKVIDLNEHHHRPTLDILFLFNTTAIPTWRFPSTTPLELETSQGKATHSSIQIRSTSLYHTLHETHPTTSHRQTQNRLISFPQSGHPPKSRVLVLACHSIYHPVPLHLSLFVCFLRFQLNSGCLVHTIPLQAHISSSCINFETVSLLGARRSDISRHHYQPSRWSTPAV